MAGRDRVDFYRKSRDYSDILDEDVEPEEMEEEGEEEEEYEEEDDQEEEQYEKPEPEEDPVAVKERQEYLQRREKLKEVERQKLRQKLKQKLSDQFFLGNDQRKKPSNNDDYGSFFGPSEIVVARRVIVETRARNEANCIAAKASKEDPKGISEPESDTNFVAKEPPPPRKVVDETKTKAQHLKAIRDYSFLFSDNAEIPVPDKGSTSDRNSVTKSIPDNAQKKQPTGKKSVGALKKPVVSSKPVSSSKEFKGIVKPSGQMSIKPGSRTISPRPNLNGSSNAKNQAGKPGSGLGRSVIQANGSLCQPGSNGTKTVISGSNGVKGVNSDNIKKKEPLLNTSKIGKDQQRLSGSQPTYMQKTVPIKAPSQTFQVEQRKPPVMSKSLSKPVQRMETKLPPKPAPKPAPRPAPKLLPKSQVKPAKAPLSRESHYDRPKKRRPIDDDYDLEDDGNVSSMIRKMFGYNPNKYSDMDDEDDRDMEVGFSRILAEERRSERIAKEEDERELALIEAEERAERERALKRRKLQKK